MKREALKALIDHLGKKYSEILGINLLDAEDEEIFKWFLASVFFGAPIRGNSVVHTSMLREVQRFDASADFRNRVGRTGQNPR
jgi:succinate dehydrogenase flavin-adding protein (antitoxin of CptAB toxin-antitoxin module)